MCAFIIIVCKFAIGLTIGIGQITNGYQNIDKIPYQCITNLTLYFHLFYTHVDIFYLIYAYKSHCTIWKRAMHS